MILSQLSFSQIKVENDSIIIWNKDRKITWDDFLSENRRDEFVIYKGSLASLNLSINIYPNEFFCDNIDDIQIVVQMNKNLSWVWDKNDSDVEGLNHEQTHFNIGEVYARKIRKTILEFIENYEECDLNGIADIFYRLTKEHREIQFKYDDEVRECENKISEFCHNIEVQQEWDKKINKLLEEYKDYELIIDIDDLELE